MRSFKNLLIQSISNNESTFNSNPPQQGYQNPPISFPLSPSSFARNLQLIAVYQTRPMRQDFNSHPMVELHRNFQTKMHQKPTCKLEQLRPVYFCLLAPANKRARQIKKKKKRNKKWILYTSLHDLPPG